MRRRIATLLIGAALLGFPMPAGAAFVFSFQERGGDIIATGSGSVDLTDLSLIGEDVLPDSGVIAHSAVAGVAGTVAVYSGITGPTGFGPGGHIVASSGGGDAVAVNGSDDFLGVPLDYVSGSPLSSSMEFAGQTFASIGLTPGTYTWTWGAGVEADSFTVQIGPVPIPEPAPILAFGTALLGVAALRWGVIAGLA